MKIIFQMPLFLLPDTIPLLLCRSKAVHRLLLRGECASYYGIKLDYPSAIPYSYGL